MTVYADVLFLINLVVNYLVLYLTGKIGRLSPRGWRLWMGAAVGALYAVLMFFPRLSFGYSTLAKFLFSLFVIALTFPVGGVRLYFKTVGIFYLVTFCFGGSVMALFYFTNLGAKLGAVVKNGILYFHLPWKVLLCAVFLSYVILRIGWSIFQNRLTKTAMLRKVGIVLDGKEVWMNALLDTGNSLCEPLSGAPVIVAEYETLRPILPPAWMEVYAEGEEPSLENITDTSIRRRLRLIPFSSLGKEHGMLIGFCPDRAHLLENETIRDAGEVVVGIYTRRLARDHSYHALLPPQLAVNEYV